MKEITGDCSKCPYRRYCKETCPAAEQFYGLESLPPEQAVMFCDLPNDPLNRDLQMPQNYNLYLTDREQEIVILLFRGLSYKEISTELNIKECTVRSHLSHIRQKVRDSQ